MFTVLRRTLRLRQLASTGPNEYALREHDAIATLRRTSSGRELAIEQAIQFFFDEQWCALRELLQRARHPHHRRRRHLRQLRQRRRLDPPRDLRARRTSPAASASPACRPTTSPPPASAGAIRSTTGTCCRSAASTGGSPASAARSRCTTCVRLDHFRGFEAYWSIAADEETAINGQWVKAPGHELFQRLREVFGDLPFIAEDLGLITPEVDELREHFGMPGMRILQFGFADRGGHLYLPHRIVPNTVVYTGTHDNDTTARLVAGRRHPRRTRQRADLPRPHPARRRARLGDDPRRRRAPSPTSASSPCRTFSHLGSEARMNTPAAGEGNWTLALPTPTRSTPTSPPSLRALMEMTDRDRYIPPPPETATQPPSRRRPGSTGPIALH